MTSENNIFVTFPDTDAILDAINNGTIEIEKDAFGNQEIFIPAAKMPFISVKRGSF